MNFLYSPGEVKYTFLYKIRFFNPGFDCRDTMLSIILCIIMNYIISKRFSELGTRIAIIVLDSCSVACSSEVCIDEKSDIC